MRSNSRAAGTRNWRASWPTASPTKRQIWIGPLAVSWEARRLQPQVLDISDCGPRSESRACERMIHMKHTKLMAIGTLLLLGVCGAAAQSLGDYARAARKKKVEPTTATRHYDNDNLPTNEALSVVGPPRPATPHAGQGAAD